jgi:hypothetical protein
VFTGFQEPRRCFSASVMPLYLVRLLSFEQFCPPLSFRLLAGFWPASGRLLAGFWLDSGRIPAGFWLDSGRLLARTGS